MKSYDVAKDLKVIRDYYSLSQEQFAMEIGLARCNVARYELGKVIPQANSLERIYSYPYSKNLRYNEIKAMMMSDNKQNDVLFFHGAKYEIKELDPHHLRGLKDFGAGLYLAQTYPSAATWVSEYHDGSVYAFYLKKPDQLHIKQFDVSLEWMYAILYYRGALRKYKLNKSVQAIIDEIEQSDVIIAPIADNAMYDIIEQFAQALLSDEQCLYALSATNLGLQYVLKSQKAIDQLTMIERLYLCQKEKNDLVSLKKETSNVGQDKAKLAIKEHVREGRYIHELFDEIRWVRD